MRIENTNIKVASLITSTPETTGCYIRLRSILNDCSGVLHVFSCEWLKIRLHTNILAHLCLSTNLQSCHRSRYEGWTGIHLLGRTLHVLWKNCGHMHSLWVVLMVATHTSKRVHLRRLPCVGKTRALHLKLVAHSKPLLLNVNKDLNTENGNSG